MKHESRLKRLHTDLERRQSARRYAVEFPTVHELEKRIYGELFEEKGLPFPELEQVRDTGPAPSSIEEGLDFIDRREKAYRELIQNSD